MRKTRVRDCIRTRDRSRDRNRNRISSRSRDRGSDRSSIRPRGKRASLQARNEAACGLELLDVTQRLQLLQHRLALRRKLPAGFDGLEDLGVSASLIAFGLEVIEFASTELRDLGV